MNPKNKKNMGHINDTVNKQQKQIDDLQNTSENHERRINTLETQGMATQPEVAPSTSATPQAITVNIPDDVVRKGDLDSAVKQIKEATQKAGSECQSEPPTVTVSAMTALEEFDYTNKTAKAVEDKVAVPIREMRNSVEGNNSRLDRIEKNMADTREVERLRLKVKVMYAFYAFLTVMMLVFVIVNHQDIEHLTRVEWLYRWSRTKQKDTEEYQDFERRMLQGTKEEREGMKTKIFNLESNAPQFIYFKPSDDWQPEPPKEEEPSREQEPTEKTASEQKPAQHKPLPHEQKSRLTPGEIAAYKFLQNDPNIPEDAKPQLPDEYE